MIAGGYERRPRNITCPQRSNEYPEGLEGWGSKTSALPPVRRLMSPGEKATELSIVGMAGYELYLVRSGCFSYRTADADILADPTLCMLGGPRHQADIGHPVPGGDTGTAVLFTAELVAAVAAGSLDLPPFSFATPYVRAAHRRLLRAWGTGGDACDLEERSIALLAAVLAAVEPVRVAARSPRAQGRARLCDEARAAIVSDPALSSVVDLARVLDCSPITSAASPGSRPD
jgi:hypothetical protein